MKRIFLLIVIGCAACFNQPLKAQYYYYNDRYYDSEVIVELGASVGVMNCFTDLGGKKGSGKKFIKDLNWKNAKPDAGIFAAIMYQNKIGLRLEGTFGNVGAYDSILKPYVPNTSGRYERNLSFKSKINDLQLSVEIHPLFFFNDYTDKQPPQLSPYIVAGIGYFSFDPQAKLNGTWFRLQPLHTEGEGFAEYPYRKPYKLNQINYPVGAGLRYELSEAFNLRVELIYRILTTDYLDDVSTTYISSDLYASYLTPYQAAIAQQLADRKKEITPGLVAVPGEQRGDPKDKDAFFSIQLKVGITLGREKRKGY